MSPNDDILIQRAASRSTAPRLLLLFHGVGSSAEDLRSLGQALAAQLPQAWVVNVRSPDASDLGQGWQWFSVRDVTEANRPSRVAAAMPRFQEAVRAWQRESGVAPQDTVLIGFSQGAIMALESTQLDRPPATRVVALSGRFAQSPRIAHPRVRTHLMHGDADAVMPVQGAVEALAQLQVLRAVATLDRFPGLGHGIDGRVVDAIVRRMSESAVPSTWLHFGEEAFVVRAQTGDQAEAERRLDLGPARIARDFFRHDPPTAQEIERAIDVTEDEIMRLGPRAGAAGPLYSTSAALRPWAAVSGPQMSVELVESWFSRLASAAQGQSQAMQGLPAGREAAAALLVLREFMHHRGHPSIVFLEPRPGLAEPLARA